MRRALKVFFHDACFDGCASAALFARVYADAIAPADLVLAPMQHTDGDPFAAARYDADDHACVDFRFAPDPRVRWWFDHHRTAFQPPSLRAVFDAAQAVDPSTRGFDPDAPSCAGLIAREAATRWGWRPPAPLAELIEWADVIDAARFASAAEATALAAPAQQLALWLGAAARPDQLDAYVRALATGTRTLAELAAAPPARDGIAAAVAARARGREAIARRATWRDDVVVIDLVGEPDAITPGFVGYELYPACRYTVALLASPRAVKLAVGWNPWGPPRAHDVGALCARWGGGGHAAVGGVTLGAGELARGRAALAAIVGELAG